MIIAAAAGRPSSCRCVKGEVLDDLYSEGREVMVDPEQADEEDEASEIEEDIKVE